MADAMHDEATYDDLTGDNVLRLNTINSGLTVPSTSSRPKNSTSQASSRVGGTSLRQRPSRLSKYGVSFQPPQDDAVHYPADARSVSFFEKGRDFESTYTNHKYTDEERQTLSTFESQDYLPSHSEVYKNWIKRQPSRLDWDQWLMMGLIGFIVGFLGFLLHQIIERLTDVRIERAREYLADNHLWLAWGWCMSFSALFLILGSALVVFVRPAAGGSGIPELIGFLNGTQVRHIFNVKTLVIKFLSCCLSVGSGLPIGPEGPMIHLGSLVGAGVSQFKSDTLKIRIPFFERFRNTEDRRNFVSAGAAAGVSAAFGAPVGGLLFSMEEVSSFWNDRLSWQIFFCCMVSVFTSSIFNSAFKGFDFTGSFGLFKSTQFILFKVYHGFDFHVAVFIPTILIGALGGFLGSVFTFINLKIARARKSVLASIKSRHVQKFLRLLEPTVILLIYISASVFLPAAFPCTKFECATKSNRSNGDTDWCVSHSLDHGWDFLADPNGTEFYNCPPGVIVEEDGYVYTNKTYNQVATLLMTNGERAIRHLFSRETHLEFDFVPLTIVLVIYFICACWSAGTSISSGLVVPMLLIGAIYGRMVGLAMVRIFGVYIDHPLWSWIDPGAMALIGAASFFGGVSRLTMSLTVIMMELTNDIQFLLPIMVAIMVAKWVGDFVTHPLYHALLELKCIPFLSAEPVVYNENKRRLNLELYTAGNVMNTEIVCLDDKENIQRISELLLTTTHSGFPVTTLSRHGHKVLIGTITRLELTVILKHKSSFITEENQNSLTSDITSIEYEQLTIDKLEDPLATEDMLEDYASNPKYATTKVFLRPYINQSAMSVKSNFSLHRTYIIFRTLGLRHLVVTHSDGGQVVGMITRRDLMGFNLEEKLDKARQNIGMFSDTTRNIVRMNNALSGLRSNTQSAADHGPTTHNVPNITYSECSTRSVHLEGLESPNTGSHNLTTQSNSNHSGTSSEQPQPITTPPEEDTGQNANQSKTGHDDSPLIDIGPGADVGPAL